jgi:hypothetical protein
MSAKAKNRYEILRVAGADYRIDDPDGCEVTYRDTEHPFSTRRSDKVTDFLERIDELECANGQLEERIDELKHASPWQPIETAPKDGTPVLLRRVSARGVPCFYVAWRFVGEWTTGTHTVFGPTHWLPIPQLEVDDV